MAEAIGAVRVSRIHCRCGHPHAVHHDTGDGTTKHPTDGCEQCPCSFYEAA